MAQDDTPATAHPAGTSDRGAAWRAARAAAAAAWSARSPRERAMLALAGSVLGLFLLWLVAVAPAWRSVRAAPARLDQLESQLQTMQRLAAEVRELRAAPPLPPEQTQALLATAVERLGERARLALQGNRAVLTVTGMPADALAAWIAEVRAAARVRVVEGQLTRNPQGVYVGTLVLAWGAGS